MSSTEPFSSETDAPTSGQGVEESLTPTAQRGTPPDSAARLLEIAATTADRLVADARAEAESLVDAARAEAAEQRAGLEQERATAIARLEEEKAALEARIASLHDIAADQHNRMRQLLTEQLAALDAAELEPADSDDGRE